MSTNQNRANAIAPSKDSSIADDATCPCKIAQVNKKIFLFPMSEEDEEILEFANKDRVSAAEADLIRKQLQKIKGERKK